MTNLQQNSELAKCRERLAQLNRRYDRVLELNQNYGFTFSKMFMGELVVNPRHDAYMNVLLSIRKEKQELRLRIRELSPKMMDNINEGIRALVTMTREDMFNLTSPM